MAFGNVIDRIIIIIVLLFLHLHLFILIPDKLKLDHAQRCFRVNLY